MPPYLPTPQSQKELSVAVCYCFNCYQAYRLMCIWLLKGEAQREGPNYKMQGHMTQQHFGMDSWICCLVFTDLDYVVDMQI